MSSPTCHACSQAEQGKEFMDVSKHATCRARPYPPMPTSHAPCLQDYMPGVSCPLHSCLMSLAPPSPQPMPTTFSVAHMLMNGHQPSRPHQSYAPSTLMASAPVNKRPSLVIDCEHFPSPLKGVWLGGGRPLDGVGVGYSQPRGGWDALDSHAWG